MKKHELIKYAYDNYPKGTKIYSTSGNGQSHELRLPYLIDECGSIQDSYGWLIYYKSKDKWAEIVNDKPKEIEVEFGNEKYIVTKDAVAFSKTIQFLYKKEITKIKHELNQLK